MAKQPKQRQTKSLQELHEEAMMAFDDIVQVLWEERKMCNKDRRFCFIAGAQWEGDLGQQFKNKPKFEINKVQLSTQRIINEYRNNRLTVNFTAKDGVHNDEMADVCRGLYRADERDSNANEAYDNCFEEAVTGGIGAWRYCAEFEDEYDPDNERQRVRIEPIFDADTSVFFDLSAKRKDKRDARFAFVIHSYTHEAYKEEWGDDPASWDKSIIQWDFDWWDKKCVYVAEFYKVVDKSIEVYTYQSLNGDEQKITSAQLEENEELQERLEDEAWELVQTRTIKRRTVRKYIMDAQRVLKDCGRVPGTEIPVVKMFGHRHFIDDVERSWGHVRFTTDMQRVKNMLTSKLAEIAALSSVEKPIVTPQQMAGHQRMWSKDNTHNYSYLVLNPQKDLNGNPMPLGQIPYTKVPQVPPAMAMMIQGADGDMAELLGMQQATEQVLSNVSGKTVELLQNKTDMQTAIYLSNFRDAVKRGGEIWLSMNRELLVEANRKMKVIDEHGKPGSVELNVEMTDDEGDPAYAMDFSKAHFDVNVDVGPSTDTKRQATVRNLMGMMQVNSDPEVQQVLSSMAMMNLEGEGVSDARKYFRKKLVRMGVLEPNKEERAEMEQEAANRQPTPNDQLVMAAVADAQASAQKKQAEVVKILAQAESEDSKMVESEVNSLAKLAEMQASDERVRQALALLDEIDDRSEPPSVNGEMGEMQ